MRQCKVYVHNAEAGALTGMPGISSEQTADALSLDT